MSLDILREVCRTNGINKVAFVDDVFDTPAPEKLDRPRYAAFRRAYNAEGSPLRATIRARDGTGAAGMPRFDDLEPSDIEPIWDHLCGCSVAGDDLQAPGLAPFADLFKEHGDDPWGMLDVVSRIIRLFKDDLGCEVTPFGRAPDLGALAGMDVVLIDFYLTQGLTPEQASAETAAIVRGIRSAVPPADPRPPSSSSPVGPRT